MSQPLGRILILLIHISNIITSYRNTDCQLGIRILGRGGRVTLFSTFRVFGFVIDSSSSFIAMHS